MAIVRNILNERTQDIARTFHISTKDVTEIRRIIDKAHYSNARNKIRIVDDALERVSDIVGGYGVEALFDEDNPKDAVLIYVNMGDTYRDTVCYHCGQDVFYIGSWGDFVENYEKHGGRVR